MTDQGPLAQLRGYLAALSPQARAKLLSELEKSGLAGKTVPAMQLILEELRSSVRDNAAQAQRFGNPARLFFQPVEPFLINETPEKKQIARVSRASLAPIWTWISRDLMPEQAGEYVGQVSDQLIAEDNATAQKLARAFQDKAIVSILAAMKAMSDDGMARQRLVAQLGSGQIFEDIRDIVSVLKARDALSGVAARLPATIRNLADESLENTANLLLSPMARSPDVFPYALAIVMGRLGQPGQVIRLAVRAAEADLASKVAETPFSIGINLILSDMERLHLRLRSTMGKAPVNVVVSHVKEFHDYARSMRTEMDLSSDHPWARRLAQMRGEMAALLKHEIDSIPGRVRRILKPRPAADLMPGEVVDQADVTTLEAAIDLLAACRTYAGEIALNEVTLRVYSELQNFLDTGTQTLLDGLRTSGPSDRRFRMSQVDAAVRFCAKVFGASYAQLLTKAAEVAAQGDKKQARA